MKNYLDIEDDIRSIYQQINLRRTLLLQLKTVPIHIKFEIKKPKGKYNFDHELGYQILPLLPVEKYPFERGDELIYSTEDFGPNNWSLHSSYSPLFFLHNRRLYLWGTLSNYDDEYVSHALGIQSREKFIEELIKLREVIMDWESYWI